MSGSNRIDCTHAVVHPGPCPLCDKLFKAISHASDPVRRALCESPGCPSERRLSGLCELHYWKREAERLDAVAGVSVRALDRVIAERDAATARETDLRGIVYAINDADTDNMIGEIKVTRPDGSRTWLPDRVVEVLRAHSKGST